MSFLFDGLAKGRARVAQEKRRRPMSMVRLTDGFERLVIWREYGLLGCVLFVLREEKGDQLAVKLTERDAREEARKVFWQRALDRQKAATVEDGAPGRPATIQEAALAMAVDAAGKILE